jgi:hypothetical protein
MREQFQQTINGKQQTTEKRERDADYNTKIKDL